MTKTVDVCFSKLLKWERKSMSATNDISDNNDDKKNDDDLAVVTSKGISAMEV